MPTKQRNRAAEIHVLSQLALTPTEAQTAMNYVADLDSAQRDALVSLADSHHVVIRAFAVVARHADKNAFLVDWAKATLAREERRIQNALVFLHHICTELERAGCPVVSDEVARSLA